MTCNDWDCESCNPLYVCEEHDVRYRFYEECYECEMEAEEKEKKNDTE